MALVVDGDLAALRRMLDLLSAAGWDCRGALDAVEACAVLESCAPLLVMIDPQLPLAGEVIARAHTSFPARVVALSANGTFFAEPSLWDGLLVKPVNEPSLRQLLLRFTL